jgi:predicted O-methyltransferase YrrM
VFRQLEAVAQRLRGQPSAPATPVEASSLHPSLRFSPPGHFYSPIPDLAEVGRRAGTLFDRSVKELPGIDLREAAQLELLERFKPYYAEHPFQPGKTEGLRYFFENPQYSYSDALFFHFMLRHLAPRRIVEVGSGYSSCVALDTIDRFLDRSVQMTCIEPYPESLRSLMHPGDESRIELLPVAAQEVSLDVFRKLQRNDVLFIDSTHVVKVGSDVNRLLFEVLPVLAPGVYVHFHDIFYPFEYLQAWIEEGRVWGEAYLLRAFLQYNSAFEIVLFNTFLEEHHRPLFERHFPLCLMNPGGSIWIRRR